MSVKRRDSKNRILRNGESQDKKNGRYIYKYYDILHKPHFLYSWKLEPTDKLPAGKKDDLSLREKIRLLQKDLADGIDVQGGDMTVLQLVKRYLATKTGVKATTEAGYKTVLNILEKEAFAHLPIKKIHTTDAKTFLIKLQKEDKRSYSSIHSIRGVLRPAFATAVEDDFLRKNSFDFELAKVIINDSVTREAITREQMRKFLTFIKEDEYYRKYYDGIYILFHTGLRISEFVGWTISCRESRTAQSTLKPPRPTQVQECCLWRMMCTPVFRESWQTESRPWSSRPLTAILDSCSWIRMTAPR